MTHENFARAIELAVVAETAARHQAEAYHAELVRLRAQLAETRVQLDRMVEESERARQFEMMVGRTTPGGAW